MSDPLFQVDAWQVRRGQRFYLRSAVVQILGMVRGRLRASYADSETLLGPGRFLLLPAVLDRVTFVAESQVEFLLIQPGMTPALNPAIT